MRILHTIHSMSPESGGPAEVVRRLAQAAQETGVCQTEIVTLDAPHRPSLNTETLPIHAVGPALGKYGYTSRLDRWLKENLSRFDGVVVHGLWQYPGYATWKVCRGRLPYVVYAHGMLDPWFKRAYPLKHLKKALYWFAIEGRVLREASAVLFASELEAELAPETFHRSQWISSVVPYGTVGPAGNRDLLIQEFYAAFPKIRGKPFVLFLGRIHKKKGCDLLIEAFARLNSRQTQAELVIAGPDEQGWQPRLAALAARMGLAGRVHFPGMLQGNVKWGAFYAAEAFALPSHQESFGVAVTEALSCGTPVLISNKVNIWREVDADGVGLVDDDTLEGTCRLLERWQALTAGERAAMAARCKSSFQRRLDIRQMEKSIASLLAKSTQSA